MVILAVFVIKEWMARDVRACVILYLLSRYMRPEGPWQRLRCCRSNGSGLSIYPVFPGRNPTEPVIVGPPTTKMKTQKSRKVTRT